MRRGERSLLRGHRPVQTTARGPIVVFVVGRITILWVPTINTSVVTMVVEVDFWHVGVFVGDSKILVIKELLFPPNGDREFKLPTAIRHHFSDAVNLHFRLDRIAVFAERCKRSDIVVAAPQSTCVDVVTDKHTWDCFSSHGFNPGVVLGHKVHQAPKGKD